MGRKPKDLSGMNFGSLHVISLREVKQDPNSWGKKRSRVWKCECICGRITYVYQHHLLSGNTTSCGCWREKLPSLRREKVLKEEKAWGDFKYFY